MKTLLLILFISITSIITAQTKWRTLSFTNTNGVTSGQSFTSLSSTLSYELNNNWALSGWSAININSNKSNSWASTQWTMTKKLNKWVLGSGVQYGNGMNVQYQNSQVYLITTLSYNFKLN